MVLRSSDTRNSFTSLKTPLSFFKKKSRISFKKNPRKHYQTTINDILTDSGNSTIKLDNDVIDDSNFQESSCGMYLKRVLESPLIFSDEDKSFLANYISILFSHLDSHQTGTVSRKDFETLCQICNISFSSSPPSSSSFRHSGIEWLSSYRAKVNSPLRVESLRDVKYKSSSPNNSSFSSSTISKVPPNFLFTFGSRPFWELWPLRQRSKKRLTLVEFHRSLLEQWLRNKGLPLSHIDDCYPPPASSAQQQSSLESKIIFFEEKGSLREPSVACESKIWERRRRNSHRSLISRFLFHHRCDASQDSCIQKSVKDLESQMESHYKEIKALKMYIRSLQKSLHESDAKNLAFTIRLRNLKDSRGKELNLSSALNEIQLENLVSDLREMSQTNYPDVYPQNSSCTSNASTLKGETSEVEIIIGERASSLQEALKALERAQEDLSQMRNDLEDASKSLTITKSELNETKEELEVNNQKIKRTNSNLQLAEEKLGEFSLNRISLIRELQSIRELLVAALDNVIKLESKSQDFSQKTKVKRDIKKVDHKTLLRPISVMDSGLYSTSESDKSHEDEEEKENDDEDKYGLRFLPPRPPIKYPPETLSQLTISKYKLEIESLKKIFNSSSHQWFKEREALMRKLDNIQKYSRTSDKRFNSYFDAQVSDDKVRLELLEEKLKDVIHMIKSLTSLNIDPSKLGSLVLNAISMSSYGDNEICVFHFLNTLYNSARDLERLTGENSIESALAALEEHHQNI